jgi:hypothetical protein
MRNEEENMEKKTSGVKTLLLVFRSLRNPRSDSPPRGQLHLLRFSVLTFTHCLKSYTENEPCTGHDHFPVR